MTREEAIKVMEYPIRKWLLDTSYDGVYEAWEMATAALREQEERSKGCNWCWHFQNDPQYLVSRGNGMYDEVIFEYCPVCGRKLEVEHEN